VNAGVSATRRTRFDVTTLGPKYKSMRSLSTRETPPSQKQKVRNKTLGTVIRGFLCAFILLCDSLYIALTRGDKEELLYPTLLFL